MTWSCKDALGSIWYPSWVRWRCYRQLEVDLSFSITNESRENGSGLKHLEQAVIHICPHYSRASFLPHLRPLWFNWLIETKLKYSISHEKLILGTQHLPRSSPWCSWKLGIYAHEWERRQHTMSCFWLPIHTFTSRDRDQVPLQKADSMSGRRSS